VDAEECKKGKEDRRLHDDLDERFCEHGRFRREPVLMGFVAGCAAGAVLEIYLGLWALAVPVVLAVLAIPLGTLWSGGQATHHNSTRSDA
jgi:hypothetical protein